jgi:hypothetical protein
VWRIAALACIVACREPKASQPTHGGLAPTVTTKRVITPRAKLPEAIRPLLPQHGIYVAGGGLVSSAWRVVVDVDANTIYGGTARGANAPSFGKMEKEQTRALSQRNEVLLMRMAEDAWREVPPNERPDPTADYDEIFVVLDGDDAFYLQGFGPIRRPLAAKAIIELRAAAGL